MVSDRVEIVIDVDDTEAQMTLDEIQARADEVTKEWKINRNTILRQVREGFTMISSLMSSFRQAMSLFGAQIDPFFSALISMVLSTASMLISAGTTLAMTGVGGIAGAVILGLAIGFQILTLAQLAADKVQLMGGIEGIMDAIKRSAYATARGQGGGMGF
jgi:hypothetical protein